MRRNKHAKIKKEKPETSFTNSRAQEEHDLAYFVHDRVELMRQVFSVLKPKEIKAMAPECVRKLSNDDMEELCLEELLGISSKRLCAILDGAEPPSDTDSSSDSDHSSGVGRSEKNKPHAQIVEVIDLDSLSDTSQKSERNKKNKHKKKRNKERHKKKKQPDQSPQPASSTSEVMASTSSTAQPVTSTTSTDTQSRASRAGMTVLELLELQARARAIRAQLNANAAKDTEALPTEMKAFSEDEVEIKAEIAEVVEISSDEEKPEIEELKKQIAELDKKIAEKVTEKEPEPPPTTKQKKTKKHKEKALSSRPVTNITSQEKSDDNIVAATVVTPPSDVANTVSEFPTQLLKRKKKKKKQVSKETDKNMANKEKCDAIVIDSDESASESISSKAMADTTKKSPDRQTECSENDLTLVIPRNIPATARKIKLNRNHVVISVANVPDKEIRLASAIEANRVASTVKQVKKINSAVSKMSRKDERNVVKVSSVIVPAQRESESSVDNVTSKDKESRIEDKSKKKKKDKRRKKSSDKELSDTYEITLQLSDSEKMDLLEDLDQKNLEKVSSSSSDSESSSDSDESEYSLNICMKTDNIVKENHSTNMSQHCEEKYTETATSSDNNVEKVKCKEKYNNLGNVDCDNLVLNKDNINQEKAIQNSRISTEKNKDEITKNDEVLKTKNVDSEKDTHKGKEDVITIQILTNSIEEMEVDTSSQKCEIETKTPESLIAAIDQINKDNINISSEKTFVVSCIDDIPIVREEFGPKPYAKEVTERSPMRPAKGNLEMEIEQSNTALLDSLGEIENLKNKENDSERGKNKTNVKLDIETENTEKEDIPIFVETETSDRVKTAEKAISEEGEISEASSSEVEAFDLRPDVVCISDCDDEERLSTNSDKKKKSKKKKVKKCKKDKKCKKRQKANFNDIADHNFYGRKQNLISQATTVDPVPSVVTDTTASKVDIKIIDYPPKSPVTIDSDNVYEILQLSDDSSCYEVEGVSVLSKEPTSEEIKALSAKIDEIESIDVVTEKEIREYENRQAAKEAEEKDLENIGNISWKDRYLESTKVKKVLTTSNILNVMRKKNKELKRKMQESKLKELEEQQRREEAENKNQEVVDDANVEEGSIEHFNMLQGSSKYVDPVPESKPETTAETNAEESETNKEQKDATDKEPTQVAANKNSQEILSKEMKKDAKQLLKMYKRLLKYNDINKQKEKDPNKKKKQKKKKDGVAPSAVSSKIS